MSKTPEEILKANLCGGYLNFTLRQLVFSAMQEYAAQEAGKAWDAGANYAYDDNYQTEWYAQSTSLPNKERYLEQYKTK